MTRRTKGLTIRPTDPADDKAIHDVQRLAFGRRGEADLTLSLLHAPVTTVSLLATQVAKPVGHILMTEIEAPVRAAALGPLGVVPQARSRGTGSRLVRAALKQCAEMRFAAVFVLGEPEYYSRFGFRADIAVAFDVPWRGPYFMALELQENALVGHAGALRYPDPFHAV